MVGVRGAEHTEIAKASVRFPFLCFHLPRLVSLTLFHCCPLAAPLRLISRLVGEVFSPREAPPDAAQYCLQPRLNVDREGRGTPEEIAEYENYAQELEAHIRAVQEAYRMYRRHLQKRLGV